MPAGVIIVVRPDGEGGDVSIRFDVTVVKHGIDEYLSGKRRFGVPSCDRDAGGDASASAVAHHRYTSWVYSEIFRPLNKPGERGVAVIDGCGAWVLGCESVVDGQEWHTRFLNIFGDEAVVQVHRPRNHASTMKVEDSRTRVKSSPCVPPGKDGRPIS